MIENIVKVEQALKKALSKYRSCSAVTGYRAAYALYVHENLEMKWKGLPRKGPNGKGHYWDPPGRGQSKFLEQPARENAAKMAEIVRRALQRGDSLEDAILSAARFLQHESMQLVPVDTGNLKGSAFVEVE